MFKPVDVDVFVVEAERGLAGNVYVAIAMGRIPSEERPKLAFFIVPPSEVQKNMNKYKGTVKFVRIESEEFKKLRPELRKLAREAVRSPSSYLPPDLVEELRKK